MDSQTREMVRLCALNKKDGRIQKNYVQGKDNKYKMH